MTKTFETIEDLIEKLKYKIKEEVITDITEVDKKVMTQRTRWFKFWCWLHYGHLNEKGKCIRCGKKYTETKSI